MRDPVHTATHLHTLPSPSPTPYPVSIRAYKKKDYDYLSSFPGMAQSVLRMNRTDAELLQERSDCDSDISMTASSVGYTTSNSSTSSTISAQSYAKNVIVAVDAEANHHHLHHQQQQHQHPFLSTQPCEHLPRIAMDGAETGVESNNNKIDSRSSAIVKKDDKLNIPADSAAPIDKDSAQVKVPGQSQLKPKPKPSNTPAVLPKFGSWDTRNPSSGDSYTLIFRRLRDEKKSGGLPICTSPTASKEGLEESLSQESKPKEPLHPNVRMRRDSSRQKGKGKSRQEAAYRQKNATRWSLCCKASVLDD